MLEGRKRDMDDGQRLESAFLASALTYLLGDVQGAEQQLLAIIDLDPSNPEYWETLARLYVATDRPASAKGVLRRAVAYVDDPALKELLTVLGHHPSSSTQTASMPILWHRDRPKR